MSKASNAPESNDSKIRRLFVEYANSLTQSTFTTQDPKTGYSMRIRRQLTTAEQQRFYNSLPADLQQHIEAKRSALPLNRIDPDEYDPQEWADEDSLAESEEQTDYSRDREEDTDLIYREDPSLDIADIPYNISEVLMPDEVKALQASPSFRSREAVFTRKRRGKGKTKELDALLKPLLKALAIKRLQRSKRQQEEARRYLKSSHITEVIVRVVYFDKYPGTYKRKS